MADPINELKAGFAKVRGSEAFSDCEIVCGPYHFKAHKIILITQSEYFAAAFKAGAFKEGESGIIELAATQNNHEESNEIDERDDPEVVKLMMEYFYHFDYVLQDSDTPMSIHAKVFAMAIKYQVKGLRDLAATKFAEVAKESWNTAEFPQAVHMVHHLTAEDVMQLRNIVADTIHEYFHDLKHQAEIETVVSSIPGLAYRLLKLSRDLKAFSICKLPEHKGCDKRTIKCGWAECGLVSQFCSACYQKSTRPSSLFCPQCGDTAYDI